MMQPDRYREFIMANAADVIEFWFDEHDQQDWFGGKPEFDARLAAEFRDTHVAVARGEAWHWRSTPDGRLAEIIVLDQFSRQLYRGGPEAFATDGMALALSQEAVAGGHHNFLPPVRRTFMLMPFMHSESPAMQQESVRLFTALGDPDTLKFAEQHATTIARFGRFPRRNAALGRVSTPEEENYIVSTQGMF
jgi:uncharacterized protein (DUF924 family)